jgi:hypothetical protein
MCCLLNGGRFSDRVVEIIADYFGGRAAQMWIPANAVRGMGAQPATAAVNGQGFFVYSFADNQDRDVQFNIQVPPEMDRSLPCRLCIAWSSPAISQTLIADVTYLITAPGDDTEAVPTAQTGNAFTSAAIADGLVLSEFPDIAGGTVNDDDLCFHFSLERDGDNALDTLGDVMELHGVALRYTTL